VMGTAATMMAITEALGLSLPGASSIPAADSSHPRMCGQAGRRIVDMVWEDLTPKKILTPAAFDNAIKVHMAMGGSTNAIIHVVAMARRAGVAVDMETFDKLSRQVPVLANVRPSGKYLMEDFFYAGGLRALMQNLRSASKQRHLKSFARSCPTLLRPAARTPSLESPDVRRRCSVLLLPARFRVLSMIYPWTLVFVGAGLARIMGPINEAFILAAGGLFIASLVASGYQVTLLAVAAFSSGLAAYLWPGKPPLPGNSAIWINSATAMVAVVSPSAIAGRMLVSALEKALQQRETLVTELVDESRARESALRALETTRTQLTQAQR